MLKINSYITFDQQNIKDILREHIENLGYAIIGEVEIPEAYEKINIGIEVESISPSIPE